MARKKKYTKVFHKKGVDYIYNSLKKYYPKKYKKKSKEAKKEASEILKKLRAEKKKIVLANIFEITRKKRTSKKVSEKKGTKKTSTKKSNAPILLGDMSQDVAYFQTQNWDVSIKDQDPKIKFVSAQLFPKGYSIKGGGVMEENHFLRFISFCNKQLAKSEIEVTEKKKKYLQDWRVVCTEPKENKKSKGEWIVNIIVSSAYNIAKAEEIGEEVNKVDYGYDPNAEEQDIPELKPSKKVKVDEVEKKTDTKEDKDLSKLKIQAELDKIKEKTKQMAIESEERKQIKKSEENIKKFETLNKYAELLKDKIITKEQFDEVLKQLNK